MSDASRPSEVPAALVEALADRYAIERELGAGGMATVYLADDLKHHRKVAIKVLRPELAAVVGGERFLAEIRTTAQLQHPNILPLFDSGEAGSFLFYVMPYVEGESLRDKLDREKQLRVEDAIGLTRKVADALDYAHGKGVVHRDIKPANILLSERGEPLVADFGIALAVSQAGGGRITETGLSLGTPHYMSPEQATGDRDVDPRSDLYGLGCVLYELLAGQPPFAAPTAQAVLARILTEQPRRVTELRRTVPPHIASVLDRALEKLPADRFESAQEFLAALDDTQFTYETEMVTAPMVPATRVEQAPAGRSPSIGVMAGLGVTALMAGAAIGLMLGGGDSDVADGGAVPFRTSIMTEGFEATASTAQWEMTISPDGSRLAWPGAEGIWVREAADERFRLLPSTGGATYLSFSPDGEWIAFSQTSGSAIRRASITGFEPRTIWESNGISTEDLHWSDDGRIVFVGDGADRAYLLSIPETGGAVDTLASAPLADGSIISPFALPGGRGVLVSRMLGSSSRIDLWRADTGELEPLIEDRNDPAYLAPGYILYADAAGGLLAHRFDADRLELIGDERPALQGMYRGLYRSRFSLAEDGTLALGVGGPGGGLGGAEAVLFERRFDGDDERQFNLSPREIDGLRWDPDGRRVAYSGTSPADLTTPHVWIYDTELQNAPTQVTTAGTANVEAVWSPDGQRIAFGSVGRDGSSPVSVPHVLDLEVDALPRPVDPSVSNSGGQDPVESAVPTSWPNDSTLVVEIGTQSRIEVWTLRGDSLVSVRPYYAPTADVDDGRVSPDGSLIAFASNETGTDQVYLGAFPELRNKVLVSEDGGSRPSWGPDGRTLYYRTTREGGWVAADLELDPVPRVVNRRQIGAVGSVSLGSYPDVNPDGERWIDFRLPNARVEDTSDMAERHVLIHDWMVELQRLFEGDQR
jgi:serine/threonine-protein kinase